MPRHHKKNQAPWSAVGTSSQEVIGSWLWVTKLKGPQESLSPMRLGWWEAEGDSECHCYCGEWTSLCLGSLSCLPGGDLSCVLQGLLACYQWPRPLPCSGPAAGTGTPPPPLC